MIEIKNFSKSYEEGKYAVKDLNLVIEDGDIYAFVGLNGAGKSTTIKSIVGILEVLEGDILIDGMSIKDRPIDCKKIMAYVPDTPNIYPYMKGDQFVKFILGAYGCEYNEAEMLELAEKLDIKNALGDQISTYSHGMQQKIVLLAAFLHKPKILILDEPFVGLDPKATHLLKEMMKDYAAKGHSIFFSTHVLEVAEKLCNKVAIIKAGVLEISGNMEDVIKDTSLESVFLGIENE